MEYYDDLKFGVTPRDVREKRELPKPLFLMFESC